MQGYYPGQVNQNAAPYDNGFPNPNYDNNNNNNPPLPMQQPNAQFVANPNVNFTQNPNVYNPNPMPNMNMHHSKF